MQRLTHRFKPLTSQKSPNQKSTQSSIQPSTHRNKYSRLKSGVKFCISQFGQTNTQLRSKAHFCADNVLPQTKKAKRMAQLSGMALLSIPAHSTIIQTDSTASPASEMTFNQVTDKLATDISGANATKAIEDAKVEVEDAVVSGNTNTVANKTTEDETVSPQPIEKTAITNQVYDKVISSQTVVVASVKGDSTFFATDGFEHGFGYDVTRAYAQNLGVEIELKDYATHEEALQAVAAGEADMALTTASTAAINEVDLSAVNLSCGRDQLMVDNGLHPKTSWSFNGRTNELAVKASHFACDNAQLKQTAKVATFYDQTLLKDAYNLNHFETAINNRLPSYQSSFKEQAKNHDHDWQLLVAMGYQESHLNANAVSPTGVQGLMMLTNATAKEMGVSNRVDPYQSIGGGARYLERMKAEFADVPNPDRLWFALASYNMGPNAVKRIQTKLESQGKNPDSWANVYAYMADNRSRNSRYGQCMHYVTNIRSYLESLKTQSV